MPHFTSRPYRLTALISGCLLAAALLPQSALALSQRTFVSSAGSNAGPCTAAGPCGSFAVAEVNTAAGGEIDVVDAGDYGPVTITKPLTIIARGALGGVTGASSDGITVNAGASDRVALIGLELDGSGSSGPAGLSGLRINSAGSVRVQDSSIFGFSGDGIASQPGASVSLIVRSTQIYDNGADGVLAGPFTRASLQSAGLDDNRIGLLTQSSGATAASATFSKSTADDNSAFGVESVGAHATARLSADQITDNHVGLKSVSRGALLSFGNNLVAGNDVDGNPTGRLGLR
jgi:hypothetical protein